MVFFFTIWESLHFWILVAYESLFQSFRFQVGCRLLRSVPLCSALRWLIWRCLLALLLFLHTWVSVDLVQDLGYLLSLSRHLECQICILISGFPPIWMLLRAIWRHISGHAMRLNFWGAIVRSQLDSVMARWRILALVILCMGLPISILAIRIIVVLFHSWLALRWFLSWLIQLPFWSICLFSISQNLDVLSSIFALVLVLLILCLHFRAEYLGQVSVDSSFSLLID